MEFASWLAGERWSDHPSCTNPALASLARLVNDCTSDRERGRLVELIPSVIGLVDDDPLTTVLVAVRAASAAVAVACEDRQRALATGLLCFERYLGTSSDPIANRALRLIETGLASAPAAALWAQEFSRGEAVPRTRDLPRICEAALRVSVVGIAEACIEDADGTLRELLIRAIADLSTSSHRSHRPIDHEFARTLLQPA
ncbi:hypothetical protein [Parafrigoribacterium soli]|uniref:hypothetical protein n=1 Tax=Parafrigoribacterium soli TaxID=3144663 RepID=UPI0032ED2127